VEVGAKECEHAIDRAKTTIENFIVPDLSVIALSQSIGRCGATKVGSAELAI
jgi:hypothetical protein